MNKILVIQNKRIGDVLIASILANNLKNIFPDSHITYFIYDYTADVLIQNPNIDKLIIANNKNLKKLPVLFKTILKIRKEKYDIILDPYSKFQSRIMSLFSKAPLRVGFKRANKKLKLPFYTNSVNFLDQNTLPCGKAIEDRINMLKSVFTVQNPDYHYKIFLNEEEKKYSKVLNLKKPIIMMGVLGSTLNKSLPIETMAEIIDYIAQNYQATILFNYAPQQKKEAKNIYNLCKYKEQINLDIYENSIRGFITLINKCDLLISNEGGSVHIAKALKIPTFTIYSPFITKSHWNSFEDGKIHDSIHLFDKNVNYFEKLTRKQKKLIEKNPERLYQRMTPKFIIEKLNPFLQYRLKKIDNEFN